MTDFVRIEPRDRVLLVTLDNPERLNTYDGPGLQAIGRAFEALDRDPELRVGVLAASGDRAFSAGADITAAASGGFDDPPYPEVAEGLAAKPVIAAIDGLCLGGGMMIATGCDLRIAGDRAEFGLPEARWNLPAQWLGALARQISPAHAMELSLLGGRRLPAARLYEMGWLNRVVPAGDALDEALRWGAEIATMAPAATRAMKALINRGTWSTPQDALALGHEHAAALVSMRDTIEGGTAFVERREPQYEDR